MNPRYRKYIIFVSLLLHLLAFILLNFAIEWKLISFTLEPKNLLENEPIVFDLQNTSLPREVIETPADSRTVDHQKKANFLSDKNAVARNSETDPDLNLGEAFAKGDFESHDLPKIEGKQGEQQQQKMDEKEKMDKNELKDYLAENKSGIFYKDYVFKQPKLEKPGVRENVPTVKHDNPDSKALEMGGLSFNTYNWNFAPYLIALKKRIRNNIFPPLAFTKLGMISGETLLRFKIYPNGELKDLKILGYKGDKSLMKTSRTAVEISAPFPELPPDFPEQYLEVTGRFLYLVKRKEYHRNKQKSMKPKK